MNPTLCCIPIPWTSLPLHHPRRSWYYHTPKTLLILLSLSFRQLPTAVSLYVVWVTCSAAPPCHRAFNGCWTLFRKKIIAPPKRTLRDPVILPLQPRCHRAFLLQPRHHPRRQRAQKPPRQPTNHHAGKSGGGEKREQRWLAVSRRQRLR